MNQRAWVLWCMFETQWNVAPMGGVIGWSGFEPAVNLLIYGYRVTGDELLAETERLKVLENAQLECDALRRERDDAKKAATGGGKVAIGDVTQGDLDDFDEAEFEKFERF